MASPLIQAEALEPLGTSVPDSLHKQLFVPSALLLVLGGGKKKVGGRGATHAPAFEKGTGTDSGAQ